MSKRRRELEKCEVAECKNVIYPSCCKKLMTMFGEDYWESPLFCGMRCFKHHKKSLDAAAIKAKGRDPWHNDGPTPKVNSMAVMIDWLTTSINHNRWCSGDKQNGATKSVIAHEIFQMIKDKGITVERPGRDRHNKINCSSSLGPQQTGWIKLGLV